MFRAFFYFDPMHYEYYDMTLNIILFFYFDPMHYEYYDMTLNIILLIYSSIM